MDDEGKLLRKAILLSSLRAKKGHIASALSIVEMLLACELEHPGILDPDHSDSLVLSKGHAALTLYSLMNLRGYLTDTQFGTYSSNGSLLGTHPSPSLPSVGFGSGSLGQGLSVAVGRALGNRMRGGTARTLCIMSDAEINEGSTWEALLLAAQLQLGQLAVLVDMNGLQALGATDHILRTTGFSGASSSLGWTVIEVDGHDVRAIRNALNTATAEHPLLLVCETTGGKGVSFMEGKFEWHYLPMDPDQFERALAEVENS